MEAGAIGGAVPPTDETEPTEEPFEFDWAASAIRNAVMEAIRALGAQPEPQVVIDAWMKTCSYGQPVETLEKAHAWLGRFLALYRINEPVRWARVQRSGDNNVVG